jgi:hypothetical protein
MVTAKSKGISTLWLDGTILETCLRSKPTSLAISGDVFVGFGEAGVNGRQELKADLYWRTTCHPAAKWSVAL